MRCARQWGKWRCGCATLKRGGPFCWHHTDPVETWLTYGVVLPKWRR